MAEKKPLVINSTTGIKEELQTGDALPPLGELALSALSEAPTINSGKFQIYGKASVSDTLKLLILGNGDNDGTVITDECGKTVNRYGCVTKTAKKKEGTASVYFNGSSDYLSIPSSVDFQPGAGDFTFDCWIYRLSTLSVDRPLTLYNGAADWCLGAWVEANTNKFCVAFSYDGSSWVNNGDWTTGTYTVPINQWVHLAIVRNGTTLKTYVNGQCDKTWDVGTNALFNYSDAFIVGVDRTGAYHSNGYKDGIRWVKGEALWTADFTPPTTYNTTANPELRCILPGGDDINLRDAETLDGNTPSDFATADHTHSDYEAKIHGQTTAQAAIDALTDSAGATEGDVLTVDADGHAVFAAPAGGVQRQEYTSGSGNFTVPAGVTLVYLTACSGGSGGCGGCGGKGGTSTNGGANNGYYGGAGGAAGASLYRYPYYCVPGESIAYTIGAGGNGSNGTAGSLSTATPSSPTTGLAGEDTVFGHITLKGAPACSDYRTTAQATVSGAGDIYFQNQWLSGGTTITYRERRYPLSVSIVGGDGSSGGDVNTNGTDGTISSDCSLGKSGAGGAKGLTGGASYSGGGGGGGSAGGSLPIGKSGAAGSGGNGGADGSDGQNGSNASSGTGYGYGGSGGGQGGAGGRKASVGSTGGTGGNGSDGGAGYILLEWQA